MSFMLWKKYNPHDDFSGLWTPPRCHLFSPLRYGGLNVCLFVKRKLPPRKTNWLCEHCLEQALFSAASCEAHVCSAGEVWVSVTSRPKPDQSHTHTHSHKPLLGRPCWRKIRFLPNKQTYETSHKIIHLHLFGVCSLMCVYMWAQQLW